MCLQLLHLTFVILLLPLPYNPSTLHPPPPQVRPTRTNLQTFRCSIIGSILRVHHTLDNHKEPRSFCPSRCLHRIVQRASPACAWEVRISHAYYYIVAETDGAYNIEVIREKVQDGVTGETREMQYTQCKIVGNGSFGVVFQTKLAPNGEDAAIKRVLQDKRFKVSVENHVIILLSRY